MIKYDRHVKKYKINIDKNKYIEKMHENQCMLCKYRMYETCPLLNFCEYVDCFHDFALRLNHAKSSCYSEEKARHFRPLFQ